jgi:hypothetical protein
VGDRISSTSGAANCVTGVYLGYRDFPRASRPAALERDDHVIDLAERAENSEPLGGPERDHSAGVAAGCPPGSFVPVRAICSSSQTLWCSSAQLRSTVPFPMASNAPSMPIVPI